MVTLFKSCLGSSLAGNYAVDVDRQTVGEETFVVVEAEKEIIGDTDVDSVFMVADDSDHLCVSHLIGIVALRGIEQLTVGHIGDVTVTEPHLLGSRSEVETLGGGIEGDILRAPVHRYACIDEDGENEVEQHASEHHEQALPRRFGAELPWFRFLLHLFGVHRLVNHTCDFAVASEGNPADAVFCVAP